ncbi:MAG: outer membrane protein [Thiomicrorhabdus sp.]|nr:MAG: outer membrane protein [Thiomicrorhabdus sp.]
MKSLFLTILLVSSFVLSPLVFAVSNQTSDLQLQNLFNLALKHSPTIHYAQAQQSAALSEQKYANSQQLLSVDYQADLGYAVMKNNSFARSTNKLEASYPLYQKDKDDLFSVATHQLNESKYQVEEAKQALLLQVSKQYYHYWKQLAEQDFLQKEQDSIEEIMLQVKQRFQVGYRDLNDISDIQARLDRNRAQLLGVDQVLQLTRVNLEATINAKVEWKSLKAPVNLPQINNEQGGGDIEDKVKDHPSLKKLAQAQQASNKRVDYARNKDGLQVQAYGAYIYNESDGNFYDDMQGAKAGLRLKVPLYLSGQTKAAIAKAQANTYKVQAQKRVKQLMLTATMKTALINYQSGLKQLKVLKEVVLSNEQAVKAAEQGMTTGNRTALDLLDTQRDLHRAQRDIDVLRNTLWQNWYLYQWSQGKAS